MEPKVPRWRGKLGPISRLSSVDSDPSEGGQTYNRGGGKKGFDLKATQAPGRARGAQIHRGKGAPRREQGADLLGMCFQTHTGGFKHREGLRAI